MEHDRLDGPLAAGTVRRNAVGRPAAPMPDKEEESLAAT